MLHAALELLEREKVPLAIVEREGPWSRLHYHDPSLPVADLLARVDATRTAQPDADIDIAYLARPERGENGWEVLAPFAYPAAA